MASNYWISNVKQNIEGYIKQVEADYITTSFGDPQGLHAFANALNGAGFYSLAKSLHEVAESDKDTKLAVLHIVKAELAKYR